jgi:hypothetical protein
MFADISAALKAGQRLRIAFSCLLWRYVLCRYHLERYLSVVIVACGQFGVVTID